MQVTNTRASGCDSVGKTVASDIRDPQFEFGLWIFLFSINWPENYIKKTKKRPGTAHFKTNLGANFIERFLCNKILLDDLKLIY